MTLKLPQERIPAAALFIYFIVCSSFLGHKITSRNLSSLSYLLLLAKAKFPLERAGSEVSGKERNESESSRSCGRGVPAGVLLSEKLWSRPFRAAPSLGDFLTQHISYIYSSLLVRMRKKKKKLRLKVQVISGDAQSV